MNDEGTATLQSITSSAAATAAQARSSLSNRQLLDPRGPSARVDARVESRPTVIGDANSVAETTDPDGAPCIPPHHIGAWLVGGVAGWAALIKALPMALDGFGAVFP